MGVRPSSEDRPRSRVPLPEPPGRARVRALRAALLAWYAAHRRDLPWRRSADPYAVWISEAMLQQTRVETVVGYYARFLERFPDVASLARAQEHDVLAAWSGLGYYRRARALHAAARSIVELHGGRFPRSRAEALALPGVGPYTAGAVLSIAYDLPEPLVDGNVERVFARLFGLELRAGSSVLVRACWSLAEHLVPEGGGAGDWNQALMELGARVCTPRDPACERCPLAAECAARARGRAADLPLPKPRRAAVPVELLALWIERAGRVALERRAADGRMAGLWQLPTIERAGPQGGRTGLFPADWPRDPERGPGEPCPGTPLAVLRHAITHHRIRLELVAARWSGPLPRAWRAVPLDDLSALPLTGMARKALRAARSAAEAGSDE